MPSFNLWQLEQLGFRTTELSEISEGYHFLIFSLSELSEWASSSIYYTLGFG